MLVSLPTIAFIGGGNMAASILGGLIASGVDPSRLWASDPNPESLTALQALAPINTTANNADAIAAADIVVLAVKPQIMATVAKAIAPLLTDTQPLFISIAAGITSASLDQWLGGKQAIVRCMPNTPALVQTGATALFANNQVSDLQRQQAQHILEAVGIAMWVEQEAELDIVTAVSGSGPAYFFLVMEAMQAAGREMGLSAEVAEKLTLQTALGAAKMATQGGVDAAELRRRVTSPNGTTERALGIFEEGDLRGLFLSALTGAKLRSEELAKELEDN
ncbi:pyrroline-5-carboxylate reductase [Spongiibacter sp. IMCC21906]|uniref:pyrroline-5-carboxylate reductase n=1 Tax=Spongiibacter sp. IMCC21906 TaxID=1620392 RepID=UPI0018CCEEEB|nr:pyrroline-5-carboxylate reductase [Spongiibacter sp. IMCC21906]